MKYEKSFKEFYGSASNHVRETKSVYEAVVRMSKIAWDMADVNATRIDDGSQSKRLDANRECKYIEAKTLTSPLRRQRCISRLRRDGIGC